MNRSDVQTKLQEIHARLLYSDSDLEMDALFRDQGYDSLLNFLWKLKKNLDWPFQILNFRTTKKSF